MPSPAHARNRADQGYVEDGRPEPGHLGDVIERESGHEAMMAPGAHPHAEGPLVTLVDGVDTHEAEGAATLALANAHQPLTADELGRERGIEGEPKGQEDDAGHLGLPTTMTAVSSRASHDLTEAQCCSSTSAAAR